MTFYRTDVLIGRKLLQADLAARICVQGVKESSYPVNDYSILQNIIGYKLVMDYARHACSFSADFSGSVPLPDRSFAACASMHMRSGMRPVASLFAVKYTEPGQTRAETCHRIE